MARIHPAASLIALALVFLLPVPIRADDSGVVTGTGRVTIKRLPQVLRVQWVVTGEAKDVPGAVAKLKEAQSAASRKLAELGAAEKSIEFGATRMGAGPADARSQYAQYMQEVQRMAMQGGAAPKAPAKPQVVIVSSTLKAEWPLAAGNDDDLFVAGQALQEKIRSAGIGKSDSKKLTPEEAEAAEEAAGTGGASEPTFQYVCKISDTDRSAARAQAFGKAKQDATDIARAAGTDLAALRQVSGVVASPTASEGGGEQVFMQAVLQQMTGAAAPTAIEPPTDEASARAPMPVALQITVTASFSVK